MFNVKNYSLPIIYYSSLIHGVTGSTQDFDSCCSGSKCEAFVNTLKKKFFMNNPDESTKN